MGMAACGRQAPSGTVMGAWRPRLGETHMDMKGVTTEVMTDMTGAGMEIAGDTTGGMTLMRGGHPHAGAAGEAHAAMIMSCACLGAFMACAEELA